MSVLVKVMEERSHWVERNHLQEARNRRLMGYFKGLVTLVAMVLVYEYQVQIMGIIERYLTR